MTRRATRLAWGVALALLLFLPRELRAQSRNDPKNLFFALTLGGGIADFEHPGVVPDQAGFIWHVLLGWGLSNHLAITFSFTTWQFSPIGQPAHLHTLGPGIEFFPQGREGIYFAADTGLGVIDGDLPKSQGLEGTLIFGYRALLNNWMSIALEIGAKEHIYVAGPADSTFETFTGLQLRFYGQRDLKEPTQ